MIFLTAKRIVRTNQDIISEQCRKHDNSVLAVRGEDKKISWKSYHGKILNTGFKWNRNSLSHEDTISGVPHLIHQDMIRESFSKMKNVETAGPSGLLSKMTRVAGEARIELFTDLLNQILVVSNYKIIKGQWELSTIVIIVREKKMP